MKSGTCPKCNSTDVRVRVFPQAYSSQQIRLTMWRWAPVSEYVCPDCGYVEKYLEGDPKSADFIRQKWPRAKK